MVTAVVNGSMNGACLTGRFSGSFLRDWNESIVIETIGMSDRIGELSVGNVVCGRWVGSMQHSITCCARP
jgi:hypothetical protein